MLVIRPNGGSRRTYPIARILSGSVINSAPQSLRVIETPGTNGREYQETGRRIPPLVVESVEPVRNYRESEQLAMALQGKKCTVELRVAGEVYSWSDVIVVSVNPARRGGEIFGRGEQAGLKSSLSVTWELDLPPGEETEL